MPAPPHNSAPISVLILTKNERADLPRCLESVSWSTDVVVLDSFSDDGTPDIAKSTGATVVQNQFDGYASQRNFGLHQIEFKHEWVLLLDADERIPAQLVDELRDFVRDAPEIIAAGQIRRRDYWQNTWLRHAQISPYFVRLVRHRRVRYEREINEVLVAQGEIAELNGYFDHFPFSKGIHHWIEKHNSYSSMEARLIMSGESPAPKLRKALFATSFTERRRHQKALFYHLPCRPILKFLYMMFARGAFLDGLPGIRYAFLQSIYEYFITLKSRELAVKEPYPSEESASAPTPVRIPSK